MIVHPNCIFKSLSPLITSTFLRQAITAACRDSSKTSWLISPLLSDCPSRTTYLKCNCEHIILSCFWILSAIPTACWIKSKFLSIVLLPGSSLPASWLSLSSCTLSNWAQVPKVWILCSSPAFTVSYCSAEWNFLLVPSLLTSSLSARLYSGSPSRSLLCAGILHQAVLFCAPKRPWAGAGETSSSMGSWLPGGQGLESVSLYPQLSTDCLAKSFLHPLKLWPGILPFPGKSNYLFYCTSDHRIYFIVLMIISTEYFSVCWASCWLLLTGGLIAIDLYTVPGKYMF